MVNQIPPETHVYWYTAQNGVRPFRTAFPICQLQCNESNDLMLGLVVTKGMWQAAAEVGKERQGGLFSGVGEERLGCLGEGVYKFGNKEQVGKGSWGRHNGVKSGEHETGSKSRAVGLN